MERTKKIEKSVSSQPLKCAFIKLELEKCSLKKMKGLVYFTIYCILSFLRMKCKITSGMELFEEQYFTEQYFYSGKNGRRT